MAQESVSQNENLNLKVLNILQKQLSLGIKKKTAKKNKLDADSLRENYK